MGQSACKPLSAIPIASGGKTTYGSTTTPSLVRYGLEYWFGQLSLDKDSFSMFAESPRSFEKNLQDLTPCSLSVGRGSARGLVEGDFLIKRALGRMRLTCI